MEKYKGWELVKMASEMKIEYNQEFKYDGGKSITFGEKCFYYGGNTVPKNIDNEVAVSTLIANYKFEKVKKPMNFFEAIEAIKQGKRVTNDYIIDKRHNSEGYYFLKDEKLYFHINDLKNDIVDICMYEIESNWYIYEE